MSKIISLLKAVMSQDMNLFRYKLKKKSSKISSIMFPIFLAILVMVGIGTYAVMFAYELAPLNLTHVVLTMYILFTVVITLIEGIYKTQGILFDAKDSDLLFSLPIKKSTIFFVRIFKLLVFQYLYNLLFMLPAFAVYAYFEKPGISFYLISIIMTLLIPIIPTIISALLGSIIKTISVKFKAQKLIQVLSTTIVFIGIFFLSFKLKDIITRVVQNAMSINNTLTNIYYPAKLYIQLIQDFKIQDFLMLLAINIIPAILFIYIASINYFKVISKSKETSGSKKRKNNIQNIKTKSKIQALISKEIKRYFSSTVYIFNTAFGIILMLVITITLCVNLDGAINAVLEGENIGLTMEQIKSYIPKIYFQIVIYTACMTSITSSSISLEGKSLYILKTIPIEIRKIFKAKIITSNIITMPIMFVSEIIFFIIFRPKIKDIIFILLATIIMPTLTAIIGLLVNLKHPKLNASSDTEVVKQSASSGISVLIGMVLGMVSIVTAVIFYNSIDLCYIIELTILTVITIVLWTILKKYGQKRFMQICS